jgi:hypothetical protein
LTFILKLTEMSPTPDHGCSFPTSSAGIAPQHDLQVNGDVTTLVPQGQDLDFGQFLLESDFDFVEKHLNTGVGEEVTGADMLQHEGRVL